MKKVIMGVAAVVIAAGGYFGGQAMGLFGSKAMTPDEISTLLAARADEINESGDLQYDTWSRLQSAVHMEKQLTVYGKGKFDLAHYVESINGVEGYLESRVDQAANFLCNDDNTAAALAGGARFVYHWKSKDDEVIGMVTASGPTYCAESGY